MGVWVHRLSEHDAEARTAFCSECQERVGVGSKIRCANKTREEKRAYALRRAARGDAPRRRKRSGGEPTGKREGEKPDSRLRRRYGITLADKERMHVEQSGRCGICQRDDIWRLVVDHCHETGKVRGLLCDRCNQAIGALGDCAESVERALRYLRRAA